jgi:hypothetical protein
MTLEFLQMHWALVAASVVGLAVLLFVAWRAWLDSSRGRLQAAHRRLHARRLEAARQRRIVQRATVKLERLQGNAGSVKPLRLQEATEAVQDARALLKIASDQVLIAENHVRKIIVEEFPPKRHERMRRKYLPKEPSNDKPFTF